MQTIDVKDAQAQLTNLLSSLEQGEEIIITRDLQPIAKLVGLSSAKGRRQPGSAKGVIWMADDFDAPLEDFKEYM